MTSRPMDASADNKRYENGAQAMREMVSNTISAVLSITPPFGAALGKHSSGGSRFLRRFSEQLLVDLLAFGLAVELFF